MNTSMLLGLFDGIKDWFLSILDNIPRAIYFFFAAFCSGIDALQCLMRKLAGLDSYWVSGLESVGPSEGGTIVDGVQISGSASGGGTAFTQIFGRDPLSEFIYGILGIGDRASVYRALHTVFISLSIFALILLVLATMIAMIKSHYNEDYQTTNPWKYIYAAIKGILTYFIMPVMVVIGLNLSSFILNILDQITAGTDAEKVKAMYGNTIVTNEFQSEKLNDKDCYTYYDFFGAGSPTTSSTMGGMLFKAAAFSANRARMGTISISAAQSTGIFGNNSCPDYANCKSDEERKNYIADQIDFAFMNTIKLRDGSEKASMNWWTSKYSNVRYVRGTDFTGKRTTMPSFSKYNTTAVWLHYDLWDFQFIVAFGGGVTMVGVMLSVILGLMSRLIKGAALFIIYPPLISLGPLDNFKAFKSWGTQFMQQVLMAYGAILGMNIIMLILPYVQTIQWFGPGTIFGMINSIVNMIILIVGILMMKDFIAIVSGFVGGADANSIGNGLKSEVQSTVKKGFSTMTGIAGGTARVAVGAARLTGGAVKAVKNGVRDHKNKKALDLAGAEEKANVLNHKVSSLTEASKTSEGRAGLQGVDKIAATAAFDEREKAYKAAKAANKSDAEAEKEADAAAKTAVENTLKHYSSDGKQRTGKAASKTSIFDELSAEQTRGQAEYKAEAKRLGVKVKEGANGEVIVKNDKIFNRAKDVKQKMGEGKLSYETDKATGKYFKTTGEKMSDAGETIKKGVGKAFGDFFDAKNAGKSMADAFVKSMKEMGNAFGLDKVLGGIKDSLGPSLSMKGTSLDRKSEGDAMRREHHATDVANSQAEQNLQKETNTLLKQLVSDTKEIKRATENSGGHTYKKP